MLTLNEEAAVLQMKRSSAAVTVNGCTPTLSLLGCSAAGSGELVNCVLHDLVSQHDFGACSTMPIWSSFSVSTAGRTVRNKQGLSRPGQAIRGFARSLIFYLLRFGVYSCVVDRPFLAALNHVCMLSAQACSRRVLMEVQLHTLFAASRYFEHLWASPRQLLEWCRVQSRSRLQGSDATVSQTANGTDYIYNSMFVTDRPFCASQVTTAKVCTAPDLV